MTRIDRLKQAIGLGEATNEMFIELKQLQLAQLENLRQFAASDVWSGIDRDIEEAIDAQKELIVELAIDTTEKARVERIYRVAIIDSLRILKNAVIGELPRYEDIKQELKLRDKMRDQSKQDKSTSANRLLSIFSGSNNNV